MSQRAHFRQPVRNEFGEFRTPGARRHFVSPILGALGDAGSTLASIAAPAITGAALGAGVGALTHGNVGTDALLGGIGGGALGYATDSAGTPTGTGLYNDTSGALSSLFGGGSAGAAGTQIITDANGNQILATANGTPISQATGQQFNQAGEYGPYSSSNPTGTASGTTPSSLTGQAARVAGGGGGLFGGVPGGIGNTSLALGALAALGSAFSKPTVGTWATPGPSSVAANTGPLFNAPLNTNVPGRQAVTPNVPNYYTYGQGPEQTFFTGNSLQNFGWKHGGALNRVFDTRNGEHLVHGPGGPHEDAVPARLSPGEFVLDHEDVSRIGAGDNVRGAQRLEEFRTELARSLGEKKYSRTPIKGALGRLKARAA